MKKRTLITSALPYANGYIHLGHLAGAYLPADIYARFLRLRGEEVLYVCGSDEHGVAITISAEKEKVTPKTIIDKYHEANKAAFEKFGMSYDIFSRTSNDMHHETAREFFADFLKKGLMREKTEEQFYDPSAKMFLPDRYVEGECPNCGYTPARGDQCDSCGAYYNQLELKNPRSVVTGRKPEVRETTHWYFKFGEFQEFLEEYINSHDNEWKDNVVRQTRSWLKQGLADRAVTRDLTWGVKIKGIDGIPSDMAEGKVMYVWFEAVLGYITATKELARERAEKGDVDQKWWEKWWKDESTRYVAFIGKDNIVFHTLIFPAMLHAKGGYILPDNVPANEFLNLEGQKFSKSRNWSIDLMDFQSSFSERRYTDALRYTLAMNFPETRDADFTWRDFQARNNNELAHILGNFVNRTLQFTEKNFGGKIPFMSGKYRDIDEGWRGLVEYLNSAEGEDYEKLYTEIPVSICDKLPENERLLIFSLWKGVNRSAQLYNRYRFRDAINESMNVARAANKYFNDEMPWKTVGPENELCSKTIYICLQMVRALAVLFAPVLPYSSRKINRMLRLDMNGSGSSHNYGHPGENLWNKVLLPTLGEGEKIGKPMILFSMVEDKDVAEQTKKLEEASRASNQGEKFEMIEIDDFMKVKLRTGNILEAEKIKKSKKLLKLIVDIGSEKRQIVAGIAEHYKPEDLIGRSCVVVANLKPAKLMGIESQGMLLAANTADGRLAIVRPENRDIEPGAEVR
ncbi:MAG: methionine--tRNA ligase [Candidatus Kapaibacterium sp.]